MIGDEELNPCSACGHPAHIRGWISREPYGDTFQISCNNRAKCINETEWFNTKEEAIEAWNAVNDLTMSKCPFCGAPFNESNIMTLWIEVEYSSSYYCDGCYCQMLGHGRPTEEEAVDSLKLCWNNRIKE